MPPKSPKRPNCAPLKTNRKPTANQPESTGHPTYQSQLQTNRKPTANQPEPTWPLINPSALNRRLCRTSRENSRRRWPSMAFGLCGRWEQTYSVRFVTDGTHGRSTILRIFYHVDTIWNVLGPQTSHTRFGGSENRILPPT